MKNIKISYIISGMTVALIIYLADQWSKYIILGQPQLGSHNAIEVTSFFNLVLAFNRGVSFSMFANSNQPYIITAISMAIMFILFIWLVRNNSLVPALAIGAVIGGAAGNVADRMRYGAVVDFLDFHLAGFHFPAFNVADSFVFIGVVVLCVYSMFFEEKNSLKESL